MLYLTFLWQNADSWGGFCRTCTEAFARMSGDLGMSGHDTTAGAWRSYYDEYAISGWLALDRASRNQQQSWGATISSIPDMDGQGWALSLGR